MTAVFRDACFLASLACAGWLAPALCHAQDAAGTAPPQPAAPSSTAGPTRGNLLNPDISVVGWLQYSSGDLGSEGETEVEAGEPPFAQVNEMEMGLQAAVDPYSRADLFIAFSPEEGVDLEEGYLTLLALPAGFQARLGKHRSFIGRFNRTHPPETAFATRPLVHEIFLGEEGLFVTGGLLSHTIPNPWDLYVNVDVEVSSAPDEGAIFAPAERSDLLYGGRASGFVDLTEAMNVSLGGSLYRGPFGLEDPVALEGDALHTTLVGGDVTFRWKDPERAIYRSLFWMTEVLSASTESGAAGQVPLARALQVGGAGEGDDRATGMFTHVEYQFARRWRLGGRYDWTELPGGGALHESGALGYLTFTPSEFSLFSLQGVGRRDASGVWDERAFVKVAFSMGPHGAHPF